MSETKYTPSSIKIAYRAKGRSRIKTVFSNTALRDFIKKCTRNKWPAAATDGVNKVGYAFEHEEVGWSAQWDKNAL